MVKESPPHPTPSSKGVSTTPYPLFSRNLHDTLSPLPKESPLHPTPLPKESPLHLTPSSQGVYATPYPLFPRILHHTLPPLPKESTAYPTPSFVAKFPATPARNYSTIPFVCLKPALLKFSLVCIYFFFIFFFVRLAGSKCRCRGFQQALNYWIMPVNLRSNRINFI